MQVYVLGLFGTILVLVGLGLGIHEIRNPVRLNGLEARRRRRVVGSTLLCILGGMIGNGHIPQAPVSREVLMHSATYWAGVMVLTLGLVVLAVWDTVAGVRALNRHLEQSEQAEMASIQKHLKKS